MISVTVMIVVIGQCIHAVGCSRTPVIRQLKQPIILSPIS